MSKRLKTIPKFASEAAGRSGIRTIRQVIWTGKKFSSPCFQT